VDGRSILRHVEEALGGIAEDDLFFFYECLDGAAEDFLRETRILRDKARIATVSDQQIYLLPTDFINSYAKNRTGRLVAKYQATSGGVTWPVQTSEEKIWQYDKTTPASPCCFTILDPAEASGFIQGAATADGEALGGECVLNNTAADFIELDVQPRDRIQNLDDGSHGVVVQVTDAHNLRTALFEGEENDWTAGDNYIITPSPRQRVQLEAPSPENGAIFELPYICRPRPLFSEIGSWRIPDKSIPAICKEAAYKFNQEFDSDPKRDLVLHSEFVTEVNRVKVEIAMRRLQGNRYRSRR
jgi:hypothetical protein